MPLTVLRLPSGQAVGDSICRGLGGDINYINWGSAFFCVSSLKLCPTGSYNLLLPGSPPNRTNSHSGASSLFFLC